MQDILILTNLNGSPMGCLHLNNFLVRVAIQVSCLHFYPFYWCISWNILTEWDLSHIEDQSVIKVKDSRAKQNLAHHSNRYLQFIPHNSKRDLHYHNHLLNMPKNTAHVRDIYVYMCACVFIKPWWSSIIIQHMIYMIYDIICIVPYYLSVCKLM